MDTLPNQHSKESLFFRGGPELHIHYIYITYTLHIHYIYVTLHRLDFNALQAPLLTYLTMLSVEQLMLSVGVTLTIITLCHNATNDYRQGL